MDRDRSAETAAVSVLNASQTRYELLLTGLAIGTGAVGLGCETLG
jgi:hypothetical protein